MDMPDPVSNDQTISAIAPISNQSSSTNQFLDNLLHYETPSRRSTKRVSGNCKRVSYSPNPRIKKRPVGRPPSNKSHYSRTSRRTIPSQSGASVFQRLLPPVSPRGRRMRKKIFSPEPDLPAKRPVGRPKDHPSLATSLDKTCKTTPKRSVESEPSVGKQKSESENDTENDRNLSILSTPPPEMKGFNCESAQGKPRRCRKRAMSRLDTHSISDSDDERSKKFPRKPRKPRKARKTGYSMLDLYADSDYEERCNKKFNSKKRELEADDEMEEFDHPALFFRRSMKSRENYPSSETDAEKPAENGSQKSSLPASVNFDEEKMFKSATHFEGCVEKILLENPGLCVHETRVKPAVVEQHTAVDIPSSSTSKKDVKGLQSQTSTLTPVVVDQNTKDLLIFLFRTDPFMAGNRTHHYSTVLHLTPEQIAQWIREYHAQILDKYMEGSIQLDDLPKKLQELENEYLGQRARLLHHPETSQQVADLLEIDSAIVSEYISKRQQWDQNLKK
ncbi:Protein CBG27684 [Caenorhabditis briggsae]|uniref:Protein CBG27684 n=1 Tax=Caenorhabditis briggsae TaxID=6238 RepID=B6IJC9_CAEBR|nr:Protein CBG27684 [Caenorhabditis briggsae]CAR99963.1 Protein CBG27684 [Caenorhabditis briggsae]